MKQTMELEPEHEKYFDRVSLWYATLIRLGLNLLLAITCAALFIGIGKAGFDLYRNIHQPLEYILQLVLLDAVFILALTEVSITILGYLKDGYVQVRYIVDTILIIMLNEVISLWFKHPSLADTASLAIIIVTLLVVRIGVTMLSPAKKS